MHCLLGDPATAAAELVTAVREALAAGRGAHMQRPSKAAANLPVVP